MNTTIDNTPTEQPQRYASVATLAARYDVSPSTIWRWKRLGIIPAAAVHRLGPTAARFDLALCDRALGLTQD